MPQTSDPRLDRLYALLPAIYRMRDAEQQYPLKALLRVISEQINVVEDDIAQLYENWFIETAEDWVVPYIADQVGYRPVAEAGTAGDVSTPRGRTLNRVLAPRREVANTIRYRRRKGTLALLELLSNEIAGWPARAVEFFKLLAWTQNLNHQHPERARFADLRDVESLDLVDGPFCRSAHSVDVRRINSHRTRGRYSIPSVGLFAWRLKPYTVTEAPAYCAESAGPHCYTFSVLGQDAPLFIRAEPETEPATIAEELNVPAPIRTIAFDRNKERFFGAGKSLAIWADGWPNTPAGEPVPVSRIIPANLEGWHYKPPLDHIAVDPALGRFAFPPSQLPRKGVRVSYRYAFSDDMGGGEYRRTVFDPPPRDVDGEMVAPLILQVGHGKQFSRIGDAIDYWKQRDPPDAVIEIRDSGVYVEPVYVVLGEKQSLRIRAASGVRPTLRLLDWQTDLPDALAVTMSHGSRFTLDGLLITGRAVHVTGPAKGRATAPEEAACHSELVIRHCTLVPGWRLGSDCKPRRPAEPSLEIYNVRARVIIEHSILGSVQIHQNAVDEDPLPMCISDSILDAMAAEKEAIGSPGYAVAHAVLTIKRTTVFGITDVHAIDLAEDSIFMHCLNVARRQLGCMRFCYVPPGCRTPRRYRCQPDMVLERVRKNVTDPVRRAAEIACERLRVRPRFTTSRYGQPAYAQLGPNCAPEIERGASDESEMGAFHNLYQPQREAILAERLKEYTPADAEAGIVFAN